MRAVAVAGSRVTGDNWTYDLRRSAMDQVKVMKFIVDAVGKFGIGLMCYSFKHVMAVCRGLTVDYCLVFKIVSIPKVLREKIRMHTLISWIVILQTSWSSSYRRCFSSVVSSQ